MFTKHQNKRQYWETLRHVYESSEREKILGTTKNMFMKHHNERQYWEPLKHVYEASERETILGTTKTCL